MAIYVYEIETAQERPCRPWYRTLLAAVKWLAPWRQFEPSDGLGPVARALVESHIKGKTREPMVAYARLEQSVYDIDATNSFRGWLRDTQESLARFSSTLTAMAFIRKIAAALWPLVIALVAVSAIWTTLFKVLGREMGRHGDLVTLVGYVLFSFIYIIGGLSSATSTKRKLFLEPITISPTWTGDSQDSVAGSITTETVYKAEDELFGLIGRPKRPEPALDLYSSGTVYLIFGVIFSIDALRDVHLRSSLVIDSSLAIIFLALGTYRIFSSSKRKPR